MTTAHPHKSLVHKLADVLDTLGAHERAGDTIDFGLIRNVLGKSRVILLPTVKNHHEVELPPKDGHPDRVRATVVLEVTMLDAESEEQLSSRWIGQAIDTPGTGFKRAITHALEDFLRKTFLISSPPHKEGDLPTSPSAVRRRPQGASDASPHAVAKLASNDDHEESEAQLSLETPDPAPSTSMTTTEVTFPHEADATIDHEAATQAANADEEEVPAEPPTKAWKAANALWRALVNEVSPTEVMDAFEAALERRHEVSSWRRVTPAQIQESCRALKKRSALPSDIRKISDREEYILSQLPTIPEGSALNRVEAEIERLVTEVVDAHTYDAFFSLYLEKMDAADLSAVSGRSVIALCRKLRRLKGDDRAAFIQRALEQATDHEAA